MNIGEVINDQIESKLLDLNTAFFGKVVAVKGGKADVQPLQMYKSYGGEAKQHAVLKDVPIPKTLYKIELIEWEANPPGDHPPHKHDVHVKLVPLMEGDIVLCVCVDRDISETQNGSMALPSLGHHELKDAVIVHVYSDF